MAKFNLYSGVEYIKDFFKPVIVNMASNPDADSDMDLLAAMSVQALYLTSMDGKLYWYYFLRQRENIDVARFILARNGINARTHKSRYFGQREMVLRVRARKLDGFPRQKAFLDKVNSLYFNPNGGMNDMVRESMIANIRQKMK